MATPYSPTSYFFADNSKLTASISTNASTDAFGPVIGNLTTQYRTTSIIRSNGKTKVFAVCKGLLFIQPTYTNPTTISQTQINIILKPDTAIYAPLKIKYFIYRGLDLVDWFNGSNIVSLDATNTNQPSIVAQVFAGKTSPPPISATAIGYDPNNQNASSLLDTYFLSPNGFSLLSCQQGDFIGNFTNQVGVDIVLDFGDYQLENQQDLFPLNLLFARLNYNVLDTTSVATGTDVASQFKIKRYQETIQQFLDPSAFWGSHIGCGNIMLPTTVDNLSQVSNSQQIYQYVLTFFQNKNNLYVYLRAERGRSYNFYYFNSNKVLSGLTNSPLAYITSGWPILIVNTPPPLSQNQTNSSEVNLQYGVDNLTDTSSSTYDYERDIVLNVISPGNDTSGFPRLQAVLRVPQLVSFIGPIYLAFPTANSNLCASFLIITGVLNQPNPLPRYYNELWPTLIGNVLSLPTNPTNLSYWAVQDKYRLVNLRYLSGIGVTIQNKVYFDVVQGSSGPVNRRLFVAAVKDNSAKSPNYNALNIKNFTAASDANVSNVDQYMTDLYQDASFAAYSGNVTMVSGDETPFTSLSLNNEGNYYLKGSYFQLGITEQEYQGLIAQATVQNNDNLFFDLRVDTTSSGTSKSVNKDYIQYQLGLSYESAIINSNQLTVKLASTLDSTTSPLLVYSLDGYFFFSANYSGVQPYATTFADSIVLFRPVVTSDQVVTAYNGEFGFDWIRDGDDGEEPYSQIIVSGYELPSKGDTNSYFDSAAEAFKSYKNEYPLMPTKISDAQYYIPYLNLYSEAYSQFISELGPPPLTGLAAPPFSCYLNIFVQIPQAISKLEFDFDPTLFSLSPTILSDTQPTYDDSTPPQLVSVVSSNKYVEINCLQDFSVPQQISILEYPIGVVSKNDANVAGIIYVNPNDFQTRLEIPVVFALVKTAIDIHQPNQPSQPGSLGTDELIMFSGALHQAMIHPNCQVYNLDLSAVPQFTVGGQGSFIIQDPVLGGNNYSIDPTNGLLYSTLIGNLPTNMQNLFTIFVFNVNAYEEINSQWYHVEGKAASTGPTGTGQYSLALYSRQNNTVLPHEALHCLGLRHTFQDSGYPIDFSQKYTFPQSNTQGSADMLTNNFMSYNFQIRKTIWEWQRKVILLTTKPN